ncbi:hypothetical protein GCM10020001_083150 [Nonomuraea salmonea]
MQQGQRRPSPVQEFQTDEDDGRDSMPAAHLGFPEPQGLYHPANEHDACGVAMVADVAGRRDHGIVVKALTALCNLDHRGGQG